MNYGASRASHISLRGIGLRRKLAAGHGRCSDGEVSFLA
jgi:hypothetical protein